MRHIIKSQIYSIKKIFFKTIKYKIAREIGIDYIEEGIFHYIQVVYNKKREKLSNAHILYTPRCIHYVKLHLLPPN